MAKKESMPLEGMMEGEQTSSITYANEVVAIIAGVATGEVEGIAGMCNISGSSILSKNRNITKGVKVEIGTEEVGVDLYVIIEYGSPIQKVAAEAQEGVRRAIESMTGLHVVRVDVHVQGVSFDKENNILTAGAKKAALDSGNEAAPAEAAETAEAEEAPAAPEAEEPAPGINGEGAEELQEAMNEFEAALNAAAEPARDSAEPADPQADEDRTETV